MEWKGGEVGVAVEMEEEVEGGVVLPKAERDVPVGCHDLGFGRML